LRSDTCEDEPDTQSAIFVFYSKKLIARAFQAFRCYTKCATFLVQMADDRLRSSCISLLTSAFKSWVCVKPKLQPIRDSALCHCNLKPSKKYLTRCMKLCEKLLMLVRCTDPDELAAFKASMQCHHDVEQAMGTLKGALALVGECIDDG